MTGTLCETRAPDAARVAAQNDAFRRNACLAIPYGKGSPVLRGQTVITRSVHAEGMVFVQSCLDRIRRLEHFPAEDDPLGHHDFGSVEVFGTAVWFKIDLYDGPDLRYGSEAPDDPARTWRVLTVLFPSDW